VYVYVYVRVCVCVEYRAQSVRKILLSMEYMAQCMCMCKCTCAYVYARNTRLSMWGKYGSVWNIWLSVCVCVCVRSMGLRMSGKYGWVWNVWLSVCVCVCVPVCMRAIYVYVGRKYIPRVWATQLQLTVMKAPRFVTPCSHRVLRCVAVCCSVLQCVMPSTIVACLIFIGHFPQRSPIFSGSFAERDLQLKASDVSSSPCGDP